MERFANNPLTTLNGAINNSVTSLVVTSASLFPTGGDFRIKIDSEIMKVTGVSSNTFTVVRAQEGTAAASHADTAPVAEILTGGAFDGFRSDWTFAGSRPSAEQTRLQVEDFALSHDNGSVWTEFAELQRLYPVDLTGFGWINQGSAATAQGGGVLDMGVNSSGENARLLAIGQPTPPYTITALWVPDIGMANFAGVCIGFRDEVLSKLSLNLFLWADSRPVLDVRHMTNSGAFASDNGAIAVYPTQYIWLRIRHATTILYYDYSYDGINFFNYFSETVGTFITPIQVFFGLWQHDARAAGSILSWKVN